MNNDSYSKFYKRRKIIIYILIGIILWTTIVLLGTCSEKLFSQ